MKPVQGREDETQPRFAVSEKYVTGNEGFIDATGDVTSRRSIITATSKMVFLSEASFIFWEVCGYIFNFKSRGLFRNRN